MIVRKDKDDIGSFSCEKPEKSGSAKNKESKMLHLRLIILG